MVNISHGTYAGVYIFEGIDGVGKTTIVQQIKEQITSTSTYTCIDISFPGKEPDTLGSLVYDIHHNQSKYFRYPLNEASLQLLHVSAHIDQLQNRFSIVNPRQDIILLDRFWWSTYVYGLTNGLSDRSVHSIISPELLY